MPPPGEDVSLARGGGPLARGGPLLANLLSRALLACVGALASTATAQVVELPAPGSDAWQPLDFPSIERPTRYSRVQLGGVEALRAESHCGASGLVLASNQIDLDRTPILSWRWRVDVALANPRERSRAGDDFAARVYVMFEPDASRESTWQRVRRGLAGALYGRALPGSALNFVWTSGVEAGESWDNPFDANNKMIARFRGPAGDWRSEAVDVVEWYRKLFDRAPPPVMGVAVMSDSDNTCAEAVAHFADFAFRAHEQPDTGRNAGTEQEANTRHGE